MLVEAASAVLGGLAEAADGTLGWPLGLIAAPLELLLSVPYVGRAVGWLWTLGLTLFWSLVRVPDGLLALAGILPEKRLRVHVVVPAQAAFDEAAWLAALGVAAGILQREANVRLVPAAAFQWRRGFGPLIAFGPDCIQRTGGAGGPVDVGCRRRAAIDDLGPLGGWFDRMAVRHHPRGGFRRLLGWGAPLMAVAVDSVADGSLAGCSLGPLTDYVTVRANQPVCLAHEIGHACNLLHVATAGNLMNPTCGGVHLTRGQVALLRMSRHVTFL